MINQNLNKENFWNTLYSQFPAGMKIFCDWIDEYKKENDWDGLFKDAPKYGWVHPQPIKYHDLPIAMQIGIFIEFVFWTRQQLSIPISTDFRVGWSEEITEVIATINEEQKEKFMDANGLTPEDMINDNEPRGSHSTK